MTQQEFWSLYDSGKISCKVFEAKWAEDGHEFFKLAESFEYNGKFWLRIHNEERWVMRTHDSKGRRYAHQRAPHWSKIVEFNTAAHANNYFKKFFEGREYQKVQG